MIADCEVCERVASPSDNTYIQIGYDPDASAFTDEYVECIQISTDS